MDYILPDDETMAKMSAEYAEAKKRAKETKAHALAAAESGETAETEAGGNGLCECGSNPVENGFKPYGRFLILLYFAFNLGYNSGYGASVYDADRGLGGVQSRQRASGNGDNFFGRYR